MGNRQCENVKMRGLVITEQPLLHSKSSWSSAVITREAVSQTATHASLCYRDCSSWSFFSQTHPQSSALLHSLLPPQAALQSICSRKLNKPCRNPCVFPQNNVITYMEQTFSRRDFCNNLQCKNILLDSYVSNCFRPNACLSMKPKS